VLAVSIFLLGCGTVQTVWDVNFHCLSLLLLHK